MIYNYDSDFARVPVKNLQDDSDVLSACEINRRDELIFAGLKECRGLIGKQKSTEMYFFYEGSLDGFKECKSYLKFSDFEKRLLELNSEEHREISLSSLTDENLRESLGIYENGRETDIDEVWKLKGIRTQVNFVYEHLLAIRHLLGRK